MRPQGIFVRLNGFLVSLLFIAGLALIVLAVFWGFTAVVQFLFPFLMSLGISGAILFLVVVLPLSSSRSQRSRMIIVSRILSGICGISLWVYSFLVLVKAFGWLTLILVLLSQLVSPLAALILLLNGQYLEAWLVFVGVFIVYGMRYYSLWLAGRQIESLGQRQRPGPDNVIDVDAKVE